MEIINLCDQHSLVSQYMSELRDRVIQQDRMRFRLNVKRLGQIMAYEISKRLDYASTPTATPLGVASTHTLADPMVLATILRAGLPLYQGFLRIFDHAENAFLSAYRRVNEAGQLEIVAEYMAAPSLEGKTLVIADPMLATGMSMESSFLALLKHGTPQHTHLCCTIATPVAIDYLRKALNDRPDVTLWCAAIDPVLNEKKYIVPGLGDAGDLCFGEKL